MKTINLKVEYEVNDQNKVVAIHYKNDRNEIHNEFGPAIMVYFSNGNKKSDIYYLNNNLHNENGPAFISYYESGIISYKSYWINGERHNYDGAAIIEYDENGNKTKEQFYLNGIESEIIKQINTVNNFCNDKIIQIDNIKYKLVAL